MIANKVVWDPMLDEEHYRNPIIHADYSDPDVIAVGENYYMVASSFNHVPGLPILHSTDLVHWQLINHVIQHYHNSDYNVPQFGCGAWAPSIRYYNNLYWVFFSLPDEGIFQCHTIDPAGEWSAPHNIVSAKGWIDPCPIWDNDGRAWIVHSFAHSRSGQKHRLQLCEMSLDAMQLLDDGKLIYDGAFDAPTLEGPKIYQRHNWYYIFAPAGGVETGWQCVLRSHQLQGPYELKVVLQQGKTPINGPHQGCWIHTHFDEDWFIHFQDKGYLGRVVHLQPMHWENDDWPQIGEMSLYGGHYIGQPVLNYTCPKTQQCSEWPVLQVSDDFTSSELGLQWQWQANPQSNWYQLSPDGLKLMIQPMPTRNQQPSLYDTPNLLLEKFPSPAFIATTELTDHFTQNGDMAGLTVYGKRYAGLALRQIKEQRYLVMISGWLSDTNILHQTETQLIPWEQRSVIFCVKQIDSFCWFGYTDHEQNHYQWLDKPFICSAGLWVGAKLGLFALTDASTSTGHTTFRYFHVESIIL